MSNGPYNIGELVKLTFELRVDSTLTSATAATLTIRSPGGASDLRSLEPVADGRYVTHVEATEAGKWRYRFLASGSAQAAKEGLFIVRPNAF